MTSAQGANSNSNYSGSSRIPARMTYRPMGVTFALELIIGAEGCKLPS